MGKSDAVLGLLDRGHQLIADDAVELRRQGDRLHGSCPGNLVGKMAVRGLGLLDVRLVFGLSSLCSSQRIDLEIVLTPHTPSPDALMVERDIHSIMGVAIPRLHLPIAGGRDLPLLIQTAVRSGMVNTSGW